MAVVEAFGIGKVYREGRQTVPVLHDVSLSLVRGEIVALEGPSGSGKTTLLSILGCILTPTEGHLTVEGETVDATRQHLLAGIRRRSIGFVFQQFNLFKALTVLENVEYALNLRGLAEAEARTEARRMVEAVDLSDHADFLPRDLSGGQKQRVAIARAVAGRAPVILADEPTANLDSRTGGQVLGLFRELAEKERRAVLLVTHDREVRRVADRVLSIRDGRLAG